METDLEQRISEMIIEQLGSTKEEVEKAIEASAAVAANVFERVSDTVYTLACGFRDCMEKAQPDKASVEFKIAVSGEAGVVLKAGGDSSFKVTLTWKK